MTIKELRTEQNLSQAELAKEVGCSVNTMSAYENGKRKPSEAFVRKVLELYGIVVEAATPYAKVVVDAASKAAETTSRTAKKAAKKASEKLSEAADAVARETGKAIERAEEKAAKKKRKLIIQSPMGGEITPDEIIAKIGHDAEQIYVRVDENKAYWINGEEKGSVDLW